MLGKKKCTFLCTAKVVCKWATTFTMYKVGILFLSQMDCFTKFGIPENQIWCSIAYLTERGIINENFSNNRIAFEFTKTHINFYDNYNFYDICEEYDYNDLKLYKLLMNIKQEKDNEINTDI